MYTNPNKDRHTHIQLAKLFIGGDSKYMLMSTAELLTALMRLQAQHERCSFAGFTESSINDIMTELRARGYDHVRDELYSMGGYVDYSTIQ